MDPATGAPWCDLPPELGNWHTTYTRFARWQKSSVRAPLFEAISGKADLEEVFIDSTAIRAHLRGASPKKNTARRHRLDLVVAGGRRST